MFRFYPQPEQCGPFFVMVTKLTASTVTVLTFTPQHSAGPQATTPQFLGWSRPLLDKRWCYRQVPHQESKLSVGSFINRLRPTSSLWLLPQGVRETNRSLRVTLLKSKIAKRQPKALLVASTSHKMSIRSAITKQVHHIDLSWHFKL